MVSESQDEVEENGKEDESESIHLPIMAAQFFLQDWEEGREDHLVVWAPEIGRPFMVACEQKDKPFFLTWIS